MAFGQLGIIPRDWYLMTFAEFILASKGYSDKIDIEFSMHRRTAYEIYLSRPKAKGDVIMSIQKFMPLPIDKSYISDKSIKRIREVHKLMLNKLVNEKSNGRK